MATPVTPATSSTTRAPVLLDPYDYEFQRDPYPTYARLRTEAPLYRDPERGFYALSRHADVAAALRDDRTFSNSHGVSVDPSAWSEHAHYVMSFLAIDAPRHTRLRSLVSKGFSPRRVVDLAGQVEQLTDEYLTPCLERGSFDFITDFAGKLPMDVISQMMGVPKSDRDEVRRLADLVVHRDPDLHDIPVAGMEASMALTEYYRDMVARRQQDPTDDLTSALLAAEIDGDRLDPREVVAFLFLMVVAGNETTTKLLGHSVYWGTQHPEQLATVTPDNGRVRPWIEETLRYDTSSQLIARYVTRDVELHGEVVPAGSQMFILLGSANRDPEAFDDPDTYDIDRDTSNLISFGIGRHYCLGANLARLEADIVLTELLRRVEHIEVHHDGVERVHSTNVRGFAHLPVTTRTR